MQFDSSLSMEMKPQKSRRINKQYLFKDYNPYKVSRATRSRHKNKIKQLYEKNLFSGGNVYMHSGKKNLYSLCFEMVKPKFSLINLQ